MDEATVDMAIVAFVNEENILSVTDDTQASVGTRLSGSQSCFSNGDKFWCSICSKKYKWQKNLDKHIANCTKEKRLLTHFFFNISAYKFFKKFRKRSWGETLHFLTWMYLCHTFMRCSLVLASCLVLVLLKLIYDIRFLLTTQK